MSFTITVEPSGHRFTAEAGESVLDAALRHGLAFPYGCRSGGCGACKGKIVSGRVEYPGGRRPDSLTETEEAIGQVVLCQARPESDLVIEVHELDQDQKAGEEAPATLAVRVASLRRLAPDVMQVELELPASARFDYRAGQYIDILLPDGERRSFSIANRPGEGRRLELHIRHVEGGRFTGHVFESMAEGDVLRIDGPHGRFCLDEASDRPLLFVAGGTGFAPVKALIEEALHTMPQRSVTLYWGSRDGAGQYLAEQVRAWPGVRYVAVLSEAREEGARHGLVHDAVVADLDDLAGHDVYVAGPPVMVEAAREAFGARGLPRERLFVDSFEFASQPKP